MTKRLKLAVGLAGFVLLGKILAVSLAGDLINQWLGAEYGGITVETVAVALVFGLVLWFLVKEGK